jgi:hypothetical protein
VTAFPKIVMPNAPFAMVAERRLEPLPANTGMVAICAMRPKTGKRTLPIATADIAVVGKASHPR